jgi:hypothetical protein
MGDGRDCLPGMRAVETGGGAGIVGHEAAA